MHQVSATSNVEGLAASDGLTNFPRVRLHETKMKAKHYNDHIHGMFAPLRGIASFAMTVLCIAIADTSS